MKVSYNWLQEYFEDPLPSPEEVGELLTFHAFELEEIEKVGDDYLIDFDILPNRSSDCMSHRGIARELATLLNRELKYDPLEEETLEVDESEELTVEIEDMNLCDRYAGAVVKGVKVGPSPEWLKVRLEAVGQRSINNVVDATNYVMQNTGQPLHAFDFDKLDGDTKKILVRNAKEGEQITTLTNDEYELDPSTLLIVDGNSDTPIAIGGVKGGKQAEVDENTTNIVLESAHFDFVSVRKTSQKLKLWTDASTRFQNNPSQFLVGYALADVVELILDIAGGEVEGAVDVVSLESEKEVVNVSVGQINNLLGANLTVDQVSDIFSRLAFEYEVNGEEFSVTPPFERTDLNIHEDLVEEVGRVYGYEHLEAKILPALDTKPEIHKEFFYEDRIRNILVDAGWTEIYGYAFRNKGDYETVYNLASDKAFLRTNLSDGMNEYLELNEKNAPLFGVDRIRLFEIGNVFPEGDEHKSLALGVSGKKAGKILSEARELLQEKLGVSISEQEKERTLEINFTEMIEPLSVGDSYDPYETNSTVYKQFSQYPFMLRDLALWVPDGVTGEQLMESITVNAGELLLRIDMFDKFEKDGRISYAFHLVFQSMERTLSDEEINQIMEKVTSALNSKEGYEVR